MPATKPARAVAVVSRMRWVRDAELPCVQRSACGRFVVGLPTWGRGDGACYVGLLDKLTGREHLCRTEGSAKAAARGLLNQLPAKEGD